MRGEMERMQMPPHRCSVCGAMEALNIQSSSVAWRGNCWARACWVRFLLSRWQEEKYLSNFESRFIVGPQMEASVTETQGRFNRTETSVSQAGGRTSGDGLRMVGDRGRWIAGMLPNCSDIQRKKEETVFIFCCWLFILHLLQNVHWLMS